MPTDPDNKPRNKVVLDRSFLRQAPTLAAPEPKPAVPCALKQPKPCCRGKGYVIGVKEAHAHAQLCKCVSECPGCFGRARVIDGNDSRACRKPEPNVVVNLLNSALIPARYAEAGLERFSNVSKDGNAKEVLKEIGRWKAGFKPTGDRGLILGGQVGAGKTYILAALAKDLAERGLSVRFTDFFQLLGTLKAGFSEGKADSTQLAPLIDVDVLFIDELGKGRNTDFELTVLDQLVCGRYNQNKTIVASTNFRLESKARNYNIDLDRGAGGFSEFAPDRYDSLEQRIGQRIFSRLREMTTFMELKEGDYRQREG